MHDEPPPGAFQFFNPHQARTIAAAVERLFPSDALGPGASDAGVVVYIDRALSGHDANLRDTYRRGVAELDRRGQELFEQPFADCPTDAQDALLSAIERDEAHLPRTVFTQVFFETLLAHTREGLYADPAYGGNQNLTGWKLLGFPGLQLHHTPADFKPGARIASPRRPRSLADVGHDVRPGITPPGGNTAPEHASTQEEPDGHHA